MRRHRNPPMILREVLLGDEGSDYEGPRGKRRDYSCSFFDLPAGTPHAAAKAVVRARCKVLGITPIADLWSFTPRGGALEVQVCHRGAPKRSNPMRAGHGDLHTLYRWALVRAGVSRTAAAKMGAVALEDALDKVPGYPEDKTIRDLMPAPLRKAFSKVATNKAWREMLTWEASSAVGFACGLRIDYAKAHPSDDPTWEYTARDLLTFAFS